MSILGRGDLAPRRRRHRRGRGVAAVLALLALGGLAYAGWWWWHRPAETPQAVACPSLPPPSPAPQVAASPAGVRLAVLNTTDRNGLAHSVAAELRHRGFTVTKVGNDPTKLTRPAEIRYPAGAAPAARLLAENVPHAALVQGHGKSGLALLIGPGWTHLATPQQAAAAHRSDLAAASATPTPRASCSPRS